MTCTTKAPKWRHRASEPATQSADFYRCAADIESAAQGIRSHPPRNSNHAHDNNARRAQTDRQPTAPPVCPAAPTTQMATPSAIRAPNSASTPLIPGGPCPLHPSARRAPNSRSAGIHHHLGLDQHPATATGGAARELTNPPTEGRTGLNGQRTGTRPTKQTPHARAGEGPAAGGLRVWGPAFGRAGCGMLLMRMAVVSMRVLWKGKGKVERGVGMRVRWSRGWKQQERPVTGETRASPVKRGWRCANLQTGA